MFKAMLRGLFTHKLRLLLSALAIVLGTMFMSAAFVGGDTIAAGFTNLFTDDQPEHRRPGHRESRPAVADRRTVVSTFVPQEVADGVAEVDGVAKATPQVISDGARVIDKYGKVVPTTGAPRFGTGWTEDSPARCCARARRPPRRRRSRSRQPRQDHRLPARRHGRRHHAWHRASRSPLVGIFGYEGGRDSLAGETTVAFTMPTAQQLMLGKPGVYSSVDLRPPTGSARSSSSRASPPSSGPGYDVKTGEQAAADDSQRDAAASPTSSRPRSPSSPSSA